MQVKQDFSDYLPTGDPDLDFYNHFKTQVGSEDDILIIAIHREGSIFNSEFLRKVHKLSNNLDSLKYVKHVLELTNLEGKIYFSTGSISIPFIHLSSPEKYQNDSIYKRYLSGYLFF